MFQTWKMVPEDTRRGALDSRTFAALCGTRQPLGIKKVNVYVTLSDELCGKNGVRFNQPCTEALLRSLISESPRSISNFFKTVSLGRWVIDDVQVFSVTIPTNVGLFNSFSAVNDKYGFKPADYHIFFFPDQLDQFAGGAGGYGQVGGVQAWIRGCSFRVSAQEGAHNYGLQHSGGYPLAGGFSEYADYSAIMGSLTSDPNIPLTPGSGWVGLSCSQLFQLTWIRVIGPRLR